MVNRMRHLPVVLLFLQHSALCQVITVTAKHGDTVHLPCTFPFINGENNLLLIWEKVDDSGRKIQAHKFRRGKDDLSQQDPQYTGRTALSRDLSQGDLTLTLTGVTLGDRGTYYCRGATEKRTFTTEVILSITEMNTVKTGSDITRCDMKCGDDRSILLLSRQCDGKEERLLQLICHTNHTERLNPRLGLDTERGCWTLPQAGGGDSCVYEVRDRGAGDKVVSSTSIRVLDPVLIYNVSNNRSRLGEDIAVTVQYSGEESAVTWEVDGGRVPERYRLIDDNRTLIIPSVQGDEAERTFRVRVTNPVSEEVREHRLEIRDYQKNIGGLYWHVGFVGVILLALIVCIASWVCKIKNRKLLFQNAKQNRSPEVNGYEKAAGRASW